MLGHKSLATTERYLRLSIADLKEAHRKPPTRAAAAPEVSQGGLVVNAIRQVAHAFFESMKARPFFD